MHNISYDYAKSVMYQSEEGLRRAQLSGAAFEHRSRRWALRWPSRRRSSPTYGRPVNVS